MKKPYQLMVICYKNGRGGIKSVVGRKKGRKNAVQNFRKHDASSRGDV